jgi:hypothetical protein
MIRTSRDSRRGRKLDRLPQQLTVPENRGPIRWSQDKRTTVQCRELRVKEPDGCCDIEEEGGHPPQWVGSASDLLLASANVAGNPMVGNRSGWPKNSRALAGRLRRVQTFLRTLGIEIVFGREGRLGTRTIRITAKGENRTHDTVRIGTGALIMQTMLTLVTQNRQLLCKSALSGDGMAFGFGYPHRSVPERALPVSCRDR